MTGYQKLKLENEILWEKLKNHIWMLYFSEEVRKEKLEDIKWEIKRAQHEDKD